MTSDLIKYAFACGKCDRIAVFEFGGDYAPTIDCPWCQDQSVDCTDNRTRTCLSKECENYLKVVLAIDDRCEGTTGGGECRKTLVMLDYDAVEKLPVTSLTTTSGKKPKGQRQLDAILANARDYIEGSGSHHRSTSGAHTSAAREKHSKAASAKKQDRDWYIEQIKEAMEHKDVGPKAKAEAEGVIKDLGNK